MSETLLMMLDYATYHKIFRLKQILGKWKYFLNGLFLWDFQQSCSYRDEIWYLDTDGSEARPSSEI